MVAIYHSFWDINPFKKVLRGAPLLERLYAALILSAGLFK